MTGKDKLPALAAAHDLMLSDKGLEIVAFGGGLANGLNTRTA